LSATDKKAFWKIFNGIEIDDEVKDLFEKMSERDPHLRVSIEAIKRH
jgi:hypothetical protein